MQTLKVMTWQCVEALKLTTWQCISSLNILLPFFLDTISFSALSDFLSLLLVCLCVCESVRLCMCMCLFVMVCFCARVCMCVCKCVLFVLALDFIRACACVRVCVLPNHMKSKCDSEKSALLQCTSAGMNLRCMLSFTKRFALTLRAPTLSFRDNFIPFINSSWRTVLLCFAAKALPIRCQGMQTYFLVQCMQTRYLACISVL